MQGEDWLEIDGAWGEGGGQLLRTAVALAAVCRRRIRVFNIRARRPRPGLAPQHLTAVRAVAEVCGARVDGLVPGSREIRFEPGEAQGGTYRFDVGTAGSVALVLQALLPVAILSPQVFSFHLTGGTEVEHAPPMGYVQHVLLDHLARMGATVSLSVRRPGYYPRGGGEVEVEVRGGAALSALRLREPGALRRIRAFVEAARLPGHVPGRMIAAAREVLAPRLAVPFEPSVHVRREASALGAGGGLLLVAECEHTRLAASALARRGVPAEALGRDAGLELLAALESGASVDVHAADQLPVYCALAAGESVFCAPQLSLHAQTALWLIERFLPLERREDAGAGRICLTLRRR